MAVKLRGVGPEHPSLCGKLSHFGGELFVTLDGTLQRTSIKSKRVDQSSRRLPALHVRRHFQARNRYRVGVGGIANNGREAEQKNVAMDGTKAANHNAV